LLILTTNEERDLPEAFLRRCIVHTMTWPGERAIDEQQRSNERTFLFKVVEKHWMSLGGEWDKAAGDIVNLLITRIEDERRAASERGQRKPGLAELIDAVRAVRRFGISQTDALWGDVLRLVWRKTPDSNEV
jgi:MoxR-like ATPase